MGMWVNLDHSSKLTILVSTADECSIEVINNFCFQSSEVYFYAIIPLSFRTGISSSSE
jgi:hypothetical protein